MPAAKFNVLKSVLVLIDQQRLPEMMVFVVFDRFWKRFISQVKEMEVKILRGFFFNGNECDLIRPDLWSA